MDMSENNEDMGEMLALTAEIVASYVSNNSVAPNELPDLIRQVHRALGQLGAAPADPAAARPQPAVPVKKSVHPDYIVCLEDGKKLKMLKRHLMTSYGMTPEDYRERWGLPPDYPMVAPNYAAQRKELALKIGLGRKPGQTAKAPAKPRAARKPKATVEA